jgi:subtilisin family serine protease
MSARRLARAATPMTPLDLVGLTPLMERTRGRPEVVVALIDGPVVADHADLDRNRIRTMPGASARACTRPDGEACQHGTFVAGILVARRGSPAPGICPDCTLLVRPMFAENASADGVMPSATSDELADAITDSIASGAGILNISAAIAQPSTKRERVLEDVLNQAARKGVIVVAAAGNQGTLGSTAITRHPGVIPVVACDARGKPLGQSTLGSSIGRRGLGAPGDRITSLGTTGEPVTSGGTSAAAPFVTGAIALLWSEIPGTTPAALKLAVLQSGSRARTAIVPPLLDAWGAYRSLSSASARSWFL